MSVDESVIKPYKIERPCEPKIDIEQLALKVVDTTESVYTRILVELTDASLPASIYNAARATKAIALNPCASIANDLDILNETKEDCEVSLKDTKDPIAVAKLKEQIADLNIKIKLKERELKKCIDSQGTGDNGGKGGTGVQMFAYDLYLMLKYRQDWTPNGYGLGELLYTISLLPNEELMLEVKTWETSKTQQDNEDATDVRNVSDIKGSSSSSNESTSEDQTKTHMYADAKGGYSSPTVSASIQAGVSQDVNNLQKDVAKQTQERSAQNINEYRASHKVKMAVSRESGSESKSTRKVSNINQTRSLNANFYEVLRTYIVTLVRYDATLALLGAEPDLTADTGYVSWDADRTPITLGQMIRFTRSAQWIEEFTDNYGVSPLKLLRQSWSDPLSSAALISIDWGDQSADIPPEDREIFARTMLRYVRPTVGWVEPDSKGALRWGYEVVSGLETDLLLFLYNYLPYSVQQMLRRARASSVRVEEAYKLVLNRYTDATSSAYGVLQSSRKPFPRRVERVKERGRIKPSDSILVPGPFEGKTRSEFEQALPGWVKRIVNAVSEQQVVTELGKWDAELPTHGVYSDLSLGICSGAEDYFEIQRQYDLERRKLEIERLKLEKELLAQGKAIESVVIQNPTANTSVNVDVGVQKTPAKVEIKS